MRLLSRSLHKVHRPWSFSSSRAPKCDLLHSITSIQMSSWCISFTAQSRAFASPSESSAYLTRMRNVGISAHIDSGKTTMTERVLFYTGRISQIHEVRGRDGVGATMDFMELEREKGITIQSAATHCQWNGHEVNIIDTPGHVDFTIEVERALRVLDGAVLVLCGVSGVQSQSLTVDRQMKRYRVPRITFINKLDRAGANPWKIIEDVNAKLHVAAVAVQVPIGLENDLKGIVDIVSREAVFFEGDRGQSIRREDIKTAVSQDMRELVEAKRKLLIEKLADLDDALADKFLAEEDISPDEIRAAIRRATLQRKFSPVFMGSALKNVGVQTMLDGVVNYLPAPNEPEYTASINEKNPESGEEETREIRLECDPLGKLCALAFKMEDGRFGQLTYMRVYNGTLRRGETLYNVRTKKKQKVPRLVRMHADQMEEVSEVRAGDIGALFGLECASGDTFTNGQELFMESLYVPDSVISLAIAPKKRDASGTTSFSKALNRFSREDPTFRVHSDPESKETIISGMGELHLSIYVERMKREYGVECDVGNPQVGYRETISSRAEFDYLHKKQSGGSGQFGGVIGYMEPTEDGRSVEFVNALVGTNIPPQFVPAIKKGFDEAMQRGSLAGYPLQGVRFVLQDGRSHLVDSNEQAFRMATIMAVRQVMERGSPYLLEPVMTVEVQTPVEFQGSVTGGLSRRRGVITASESEVDFVRISAEVPLGQMFGYSTELRSMTQGKGEYSMEYLKHARAAFDVEKSLKDEYQKKRASEAA